MKTFKAYTKNKILKDDDTQYTLTDGWVYVSDNKFLNIKSGLVAVIRDLSSYNQESYEVVVYSLHNPADRSNDGNNELTTRVSNFDEAFEIIKRLCLNGN